MPHFSSSAKSLPYGSNPQGTVTTCYSGAPDLVIQDDSDSKIGSKDDSYAAGGDDEAGDNRWPKGEDWSRDR